MADSNVTELGTDGGSPPGEDATKTWVDSGGTTTWRGITEPEDRPTRAVAVTAALVGLARMKSTVDLGVLVVWAKRQVSESAGAPSWSDTPPAGPEDHCWNSLATRVPDWDTTKVAMAEASWT